MLLGLGQGVWLEWSLELEPGGVWSLNEVDFLGVMSSKLMYFTREHALEYRQLLHTGSELLEQDANQHAKPRRSQGI